MSINAAKAFNPQEQAQQYRASNDNGAAFQEVHKVSGSPNLASLMAQHAQNAARTTVASLGTNVEGGSKAVVGEQTAALAARAANHNAQGNGRG